MTSDAYNQQQLEQEELTGEHLTELTLLWQETYKLEEDGFCGPVTRRSLLAERGDQELPANTTLGAAALAVAKSQIGLGEEGDNNRGPHVAKYRGREDDPGDKGSWCAAFVSWCFRQASERTGTEMPFGSSEGAKQLFKNAKQAGLSTAKPLPGDIVCWHRGDPKGWQGHIGIVAAVGEGVFHTVEGNVGRYPARVRRFVHELDDDRLIGFVRIV